MKFELDLTSMHDHPDVGRSMLVALMSVLPQDEVELAIGEWRAVLTARRTDAVSQLTLEAVVTDTPPWDASVEAAPAEAPAESEPTAPPPEPTKRKRGRPPKDDGQPKPNGSEPDAPPASPPVALRALCRRLEVTKGLAVLIGVMKKHGVVRLDEIEPELEPQFRAEIAELLA